MHRLVPAIASVGLFLAAGNASAQEAAAIQSASESVPALPATVSVPLGVVLVAVAVIAIVASLAFLQKWMRAQQNEADRSFFNFMAIYIAGFAAVVLLVRHGVLVVQQKSPSLFDLLGEISVVLIVWFFFFRLHTVGELTDRVGELVKNMQGQTDAAGRQFQTAQNDLQTAQTQLEKAVKGATADVRSAQASLDQSVGNLLATTGILNAPSIKALTDRGEISDWYGELATVRQAIVDAYFNATPGEDLLKRVLVRTTFFSYFAEVAAQLKKQLLFSTTLDVHARLVFELGVRLSEAARKQDAAPVMCFGNIFAVDKFFNYNSDFNNNPPCLGRAMNFMDEYVAELGKLRTEHGIEHYRFTFVEDQSTDDLMVLSSAVLQDEATYFIYGDIEHGIFVPRRLNKPAIEAAIKARLIDTQPNTDECYLILPAANVPLPNTTRHDALKALGVVSKPLYEHFEMAMHGENAKERCRVVPLSDATARRLLGGNNATPLTDLVNRFPKVRQGYGTKAKDRPVADFVAFCLRPNTGANKGMLSAAVVVADRVDTQHDTVLLRLIHEQPNVNAIDTLLQALVADQTLSPLTAYSVAQT
jgi:hypothetical protein